MSVNEQIAVEVLRLVHEYGTVVSSETGRIYAFLSDGVYVEVTHRDGRGIQYRGILCYGEMRSPTVEWAGPWRDDSDTADCDATNAVREREVERVR